MGEPDEVLDELIEPVIVGDAVCELDILELAELVFDTIIVLDTKELAVGVLEGAGEYDAKALVVDDLDVVAVLVLVLDSGTVYVNSDEYVCLLLGRELTLRADVLVDVLLDVVDKVGRTYESINNLP